MKLVSNFDVLLRWMSQFCFGIRGLVQQKAKRKILILMAVPRFQELHRIFLEQKTTLTEKRTITSDHVHLRDRSWRSRRVSKIAGINYLKNVKRELWVRNSHIAARMRPNWWGQILEVWRRISRHVTMLVRRITNLWIHLFVVVVIKCIQHARIWIFIKRFVMIWKLRGRVLIGGHLVYLIKARENCLIQ